VNEVYVCDLNWKAHQMNKDWDREHDKDYYDDDDDDDDDEL